MIQRKARVLYGALIGAGIGLVRSAFDDPTAGGSYIPQTTPGWVSYYIAYSLPYAAVGAFIGAAVRRKPATAEPGLEADAGAVALPKPSTALERFGHVLGWTGNLIALLFIGLGLYALAQASGDAFAKGAAIALGVIAFLIGRACRYVLAGSF